MTAERQGKGLLGWKSVGKAGERQLGITEKRGDGSLRLAVMGRQAREGSKANSVVPMVGKNTGYEKKETISSKNKDRKIKLV